MLDEGAKAPFRAHETDAGWDICSTEEKDVSFFGTTFLTGLHVAIPKGYYIEVANRSGLAIKYGVTLHGNGTIDAGYTGEIKVKLYNDGDTFYSVNKGDRIAQMIIHPFEDIEWERVDSLEDTDRGNNGFGSSGK